MNAVKAVVALWLAALCAAAPAHAFAQTVRELPDFTRLVDDQGNAVVNISTTQAPRRTGAAPQVPGMEDEEVLEFFRASSRGRGLAPRRAHLARDSSSARTATSSPTRT